MRKRPLTKAEITAAFDGCCKVILKPKELAEVVGVGVRTIYVWIAHGRLDGAFRKRGNHQLIWRDRAIDILFNGPDWTNEKRDKTRTRR